MNTLDVTTKHRVGKLTKTFNSIVALVQRGGTVQSLRAQKLIDQYATLCSEGRQTGAWRIHCANINAALDHTGHDLFA